MWNWVGNLITAAEKGIATLSIVGMMTGAAIQGSALNDLNKINQNSPELNGPSTSVQQVVDKVPSQEAAKGYKIENPTKKTAAYVFAPS